MTLSEFLHHPIQSYKDSKRIRHITEGYLTKSKPYTPKTVKDYFVEFKKFKSDQNVPKVGIAYGALDVKMDKMSLRNIKNFLMGYLNENFLSVANSICNEFKENTIAVAIAETNFQVGDNVGEFKIIDTPKPPSDSVYHAYNRKPPNYAIYFTYRRISPNVQATYLNEGGREFLAGIVYYPEVHERHSSSDIQLIYQEQAMSDYYPYDVKRNYEDRNTVYGRYCESAGRKVLVKHWNEQKEWPHHKIYDLKKDEWVFEECKECRDDYDEFDSADEKIEFALIVRMTDDPLPRPQTLLQKLSFGPILFCKELNGIRKIVKEYPELMTPHIPKIMQKMSDWRVHKNKKGHAYIGLAMADKFSNLIRDSQLKQVENWIVKLSKVPSLPTPLTPNTLAISIPWDGFQCGSHAYEFLSIRKLPEGAWFSYKRVSPNIQLTIYNDQHKKDVAGVCYFLSPRGKAELLSSNGALLYQMASCSRHPPGGALNRDCRTAEATVLLQKSSGRHIEYNHWKGKWVYKDCRNCMKWHLVNWMINYEEEVTSFKSDSPEPSLSRSHENLSSPQENWLSSCEENLPKNSKNEEKKEENKGDFIGLQEPIYAKILRDREIQQAQLGQLIDSYIKNDKKKMICKLDKFTDVEPIYAEVAKSEGLSGTSTRNISSNVEKNVRKVQNGSNPSRNNGVNEEPSLSETAEEQIQGSTETVLPATINQLEYGTNQSPEIAKPMYPNRADTEKLILDYVMSTCSGSFESFCDLEELSSLQNSDDDIVHVGSVPRKLC